MIRPWPESREARRAVPPLVSAARLRSGPHEKRLTNGERVTAQRIGAAVYWETVSQEGVVTAKGVVPCPTCLGAGMVLDPKAKKRGHVVIVVCPACTSFPRLVE